MSTNMIEVLEKTMSAVDPKQLEEAEAFLKSEADKNLPTFLKTLSDIFVNKDINQATRMAAGLKLKDNLTSEDKIVKIKYQQRWMRLPKSVRRYIKGNIVLAMGMENGDPNSAAQCAARVAVVELPDCQWKEIMPMLCKNAKSKVISEQLKLASLEALGYVCRDTEEGLFCIKKDPVLTGIIPAMASTEPKVCLVATQALFNALDFTKYFFTKRHERHKIIDAVCVVTQSIEIQICVAGLQCLERIANLFYHYMEPYMTKKIIPLSLQAIKAEPIDVSLKGMEFWSTVCNKEIIMDMERSTPEGRRKWTRMFSSKYYTKNTLEKLVPVLTVKLTKPDNCDEESEWELSKAALCCLKLISKCCKDEFVQQILPFFEAHIKNPNWRYRESALKAFGSILEGVERDTLKSLINNAMPTLIEATYDPCVPVKVVAAWTLGYICELCPTIAVNKQYLKSMVQCLLNGLKAEPIVVVNVCWTINGLCKAAYKTAEYTPGLHQPKTYCISQHYNGIAQGVLEAARREDANQYNLRYVVYETLLEFIRNSPRDCNVTAQKTTMKFLDHLEQGADIDSCLSPTADSSKINDLRVLLCITLQSVLKKMPPRDVTRVAEALMTEVLTICDNNIGEVGGLQDDIMMTVDTVVVKLGEDFLKYIDEFKPYLLASILDTSDAAKYRAALSVVANIARVLKDKAEAIRDIAVDILLENFGSSAVLMELKTDTHNALGVMITYMNINFTKFFDKTLQQLLLIGATNNPTLNAHIIEGLNQLREDLRRYE